MRSALQAIVFDFDGVIANSEPLHLQAFQRTLAEDGMALSAREYYTRYLGYDDFGVFEALARDRGWRIGSAELEALVERKGRRMQELMQGDSVLFPGAREFIVRAARSVPLAIASGALRREIDEILEHAGLAHLFGAVVAAGDAEGKPSPEPYRLAIERLQDRTGGPLDPGRSVAIEDSRWGLQSARDAGLRCVGVTTSYPADELPGAELVVGGLTELTLPMLDELCAREAR